jgi:hypothetical protein
MPIFVEFPDFVHHRAMADALTPTLGPVMTAGFVTDAGECFGESDGLKIAAGPGDTRLRQIIMRTSVRKDGGT